MDAAPPTNRSARRRLLAAVAASAVAALWAPTASQGDLRSSTAAAARLRAGIAAQTKRIGNTTAILRVAETRLSALEARASARQAELAAVERDFVAARTRLTRLENKLHRASTALAANLVTTYEGSAPDVITVVLGAHGFADLLDRIDFLQRVALHDAQVLHDAKSARVQVVRQTVELAGLQTRDRALTAEVLAARDAAASSQRAILAQQTALLRGRAGDRQALARVRGQISALVKRAQAVAAPAPVGGRLPIDVGGLAQAPAGAPAAVAEVIAAGNAIAGLPYLYGGGHGSFRANAYDCSGSVSYALAAAGLLSSPLDSTGFESWGESGPGRWITVYANAGHAFMVVAGWRFDTVALAADGTRWTRTMTSTGGFVARHPPGL
jgi:peptidoglycan hydrolase CwlO-like protein